MKKSVSSGLATHRMEQQSRVVASLPLAVNRSPTCNTYPCMLSLSVANIIGVIHGLKQHAREILHYHQVQKQCKARSNDAVKQVHGCS